MPGDRRLFDPLAALRAMGAAVMRAPEETVRAVWDRQPSIPMLRKARQIEATYTRLLLLQLDHGGASVQKLVAQGHLVLRGGRYVRPGTPPTAPPAVPG